MMLLKQEIPGHTPDHRVGVALALEMETLRTSWFPPAFSKKRKYLALGTGIGEYVKIFDTKPIHVFAPTREIQRCSFVWAARRTSHEIWALQSAKGLTFGWKTKPKRTEEI